MQQNSTIVRSINNFSSSWFQGGVQALCRPAPKTMAVALLSIGWLLLGPGGHLLASSSLGTESDSIAPASISAPASLAEPVSEDPLLVSQEARLWAQEMVGPEGTPIARLRRLHRALTSSKGRGIRQELWATPTASEAFEQRRANCVAYAHLLVGLARELGIDAYFVYPPGLKQPGRRAQYQILERHLATGFGPTERPLVIDLAGIQRAAPGETLPLSDRTARAIFLSNRGAEALLADRPRIALTWLRSALATAPELMAARKNYAVAWRRLEGRQ